MLETIFSAASGLALLGWLCLLAAHRQRWAHWWLAGVAIPGVLAVLYLALMVSSWGTAQGGFDSLANVASLFRSPPLLLAGWVHYLAFDLFIGAWQARRAVEHAMPWWQLAPCLLLTFLLGPVGWLLFMAIDRGRGDGLTVR
jgi:Domain of unknown function (DUF4281)